MFLISLSNSLSGNFSNKPPLLNYNTTADDRNVYPRKRRSLSVSQRRLNRNERRGQRETDELSLKYELYSILSEWMTDYSPRAEERDNLLTCFASSRLLCEQVKSSKATTKHLDRDDDYNWRLQPPGGRCWTTTHEKSAEQFQLWIHVASFWWRWEANTPVELAI